MKINDLYERVTRSIVADLEVGVPIWVQPWKTSRRSTLGLLPANFATGRTYSGINIPILWSAAREAGYVDNAWMTFQQAVSLKANVRKGESGTHIVFTKKIPAVKDDEETLISMLRTYTVFNIAQIDGLSPRPTATDEIETPGDEVVLGFIDGTKAAIKHGGSRACFVPSLDLIQMPTPSDFKSPASYFATTLHELGHWTGHKSRLNRDLKNRFGTKAYAAEELIAELTSAFLCAHLAIDGELRHASYIGEWIKLLKEDLRAIFTAASKASQAADFLRALSGDREVNDELEHVSN